MPRLFFAASVVAAALLLARRTAPLIAALAPVFPASGNRGEASTAPGKGAINVSAKALGEEQKAASPVAPLLHGLQLAVAQPRGLVETLHSYAGVLYYGNLLLGGQSFDVIFDTGSSDVWLLRENATLPRGSGARPGYRGAVAGPQQVLRYGSGSVRGHAAQAAVTLAHVEVPGLDFLAAEDVTDLGAVFAQGHLDGLVGLGLPALSVTRRPSLLDQLKTQGVVAARQFTVMLAPPGPRLALGGVDPALDIAALIWRPLTGNGYWQVRLDSVSAGNVALGPYERCIVDSGSSYLAAPTADVRRLSDALGAMSRNDGTWGAPARNAQLLLRFGGATLALNAIDLRTEDGDLAMQSYDSRDGVPTFVLGDAFLRRYAVVFDQDGNRLGFVNSTK